MKGLLLVLTASIAILVPPAGDAAVFRVGIGFGCSHADLGDAIAAARANGPESDEIRLTGAFTNVHAAGPWVIRDHALTIRGGYRDCLSTDASGSRTTITSRNAGSLLTIEDATARAVAVVLENLELTAPDPSPGLSATAGGALRVVGNPRVTLANVRISGFRARRGGAVDLADNPEGSPVLAIRNSMLHRNEATSGGALHCSGLGRIRLEPGARIEANEAQEGGGLWSSGCLIEMQSRSELRANTADSGGGLFGVGGTQVRLSWSDASGPPRVIANRASSWGGGMFLADAGTQLVATGVHWIDNAVQSDLVGGEGAALVVGWHATARIGRDPRCPLTATGCSVFSGNHAETNADFAFPSLIDVRVGSHVGISGTAFLANTMTANGAPEGAIFNVLAGSPDESLLTAASLLVRNNVARHLFAADRHVSNDVVHVGRVRAQGVTEYDNGFASVVGAWAAYFGPTVAPVDLRTSIIRTLQFTAPGQAVAGAFDCLLVRRAPEQPATRLLVVPSLADVLDPATGIPTLNSDAVDYCDAAGLTPETIDVRGKARVVQDPRRSDRHGPFDVGAFEREAAPLVVF